ncbi:MAG: NADH-quinone oxidoreductase subunit C [Acidobacteriota bacterium]|nr:NADH-quinone oxidoreductase subunit C [Acidobacteriota bacterium]
MGAATAFPGSGRYWDDGTSVARLREQLPDTVLDEVEFRGERTVVIDREAVLDVLSFLRDDEACTFDFLTDITAVHWPDRAEPFEVVWLLYSFRRNRRLRVKVREGVEPSVPTAVPLWPAAGWLERECYDMFGIDFEGHPDLRRILLPDDFEGWPLRKEFPLKR